MLQENVNRVKETIINDLKKGQETIFNGLVVNVLPNRLPEPLFANYFLPGFLGTNPNQNWMLEWISIAGSPSSEVSVFDPATQQELFRVPPVLASRNILLPKNEGDLGDIFKRHEMMAGSLGSSGTNYLFNALEQKSTQAIASYQNDTDERWRAILARYGYAPQNAPQTLSSSTDEMFDY
jgi:hypothetical protein